MLTSRYLELEFLPQIINNKPYQNLYLDVKMNTLGKKVILILRQVRGLLLVEYRN